MDNEMNDDLAFDIDVRQLSDATLAGMSTPEAAAERERRDREHVLDLTDDGLELDVEGWDSERGDWVE